MLGFLWRTSSSTPAHHNATPAQHNTSSSTGNASHDRAPLVFFHVPKAGTSFTSALLEYGYHVWRKMVDNLATKP